ncbi:hypothetical protein VMCG_04546 [Cytospora schulzeri]|uniref:Uncharacterized protein n=1 Tax=Cytospora schulzeri TaxID=448051 RepID=A0A423WRZ7_9PEZI|nr:hypothetical protein VMCG_04546 [Valsa malicola]
MFDVDWSDPHRESVGDRRARKRKEKEGNAKRKGKGLGKDEEKLELYKKEDQQSSQKSGYGSVRSSMSSVDKQFGFFGGKNKRKGLVSAETRSTKTKSTKTQSTASSSLRSPTVTIQEQELSPNETTSVPSTASPQFSGIVNPPGSPGLPRKRFSSFSESIFKNWDESAPGGSLLGCDMANPRPGTKTVLTQYLGDGNSSITKCIEVTSRSRMAVDVDYLVSETVIFTGDGKNEPKDTASPKTTHWQPPPQITEDPRHLPTVPESPSPTTLDEVRHLAPIISDSTPAANRDFSKAKSRHRPKPRLNAPPIVPASQHHIGNPCLWKAPNDWAYSPTETAVSPVEEYEAVLPTGAEEESRLALDLTSMQREATRMLQASPRAILLRLKGAWGGYDLNTSFGDDPADPVTAALESALTYKELEMEKKRWMICVMRHMDAITDPEGVLSMPKVMPRVQKILSLFDSQATASYLAYFNTGVPIYHLSPDPLSRKQYPNIHPMHCPFISASSVSFAKETYSTVNCLSIASIVPSSEIPHLLERIHQVLARGGSLNIVILDPIPSTRSAGPLLRQWLDENLVFNLEQQFRCTSPSRHFPVWLQEARLRARGSVITTTRFQALRTVVGRMLWQDVWGPFVTADRWWWDVPEIVDECISLETHWEYSIIMACKEAEG